jgi:hypothetical protein
MLGMAKKSNKPKKGPGRPAGRIPTVPIFARIAPALGQALDGYVASVRPKTTQTAVLELALEEYLAKHGFWPPAAGDSAD